MNPASLAMPKVPADVARPLLSIMVPTWQPTVEHLDRTIRSVISQRRDAQIEIVDDCSPDFDAAAFASRFESGAISVYRQAKRLGLAGNWNACVARARGRWVHILHQDDWVLPGFYNALLQGVEREPTVAAAFCASYYASEQGKRWAPRLVPMTKPGVLRDWQQHVFVRLSIQCSAIIVRRDIYERLSGFDASFSYAVDWDMWKRIAVQEAIWYHPEPLACYRMHAGSETNRQRQTGQHLNEIFRSIDYSARLFAPAVATQVSRRARASYVIFAVESGIELMFSVRGWASAMECFRIARREGSVVAVIAALFRITVRGGLRALTRFSGN
jgi:glycosyltransferase involved in cell wall biosynthesis